MGTLMRWTGQTGRLLTVLVLFVAGSVSMSLSDWMPLDRPAGPPRARKPRVQR